MTQIFIDEVEYTLEDMKPEQQAMVSHVSDIDTKINAAKFQLDQLSVAKQAFIDMLKKSLES